MAIQALKRNSELVETAHYLGLIQPQSVMYGIVSKERFAYFGFYFNGIEKSGKSTGLIILREQKQQSYNAELS